MNRLSDFLWCVLFAFVACVFAIKMSPQEAKASEAPPKLPELTMPKFINPVGYLDLQIDLDKGVANIKSDAGLQSVNATVNHPAAPSVKPIKPVVKWKVKTEFVEKVVLFKLPAEKVYLYIPTISRPTVVEELRKSLH